MTERAATRSLATPSAVRDAIVAERVVLCVRLGARALAGAPLVDLCRSAARGGLRVLELTLTTPGAIDAIRELSGEEGLVVGAGTVTTPDEARAAAEAGARFAMSPVLSPDVGEECARLGVLFVPGTATPTEILAAHRAGAPLVKIFPAAPLGGPAFVRAVLGPLPGVTLLPTSGPSSENLAGYFAAGAVAVGVGAEVFAGAGVAGGSTAGTPATVGPMAESVEKAASRMRRAADAAR